jgi:alkylation response protein AidB-like acyl-CoA dehydrogenase
VSACVTDVAKHADVDVWRDLVPSAERAEFVASVRRHLAERYPLSGLRAAFDRVPCSAGSWDEIAASGYPLVGVPESAGGAGSLVDLVALLEEAGRALLSVPLLATVLSVQTRLVASVPFDEESATVPAGFGLAREGRICGSALTAARVGIIGGAAAQRLTVVVPDGDGTIVTEIDGAALRPTDLFSHIDPGRPLAVLDVADVPAVATARVDASVDDVLRPARIAVAADLVGVAAGALDRSVRHALDREQFGRKLGQFQAVKHALADVYVGIERARSLTRAASIALADPLVETPAAHTLPLLAKAAAADAALRATSAFVQVLGAMGVTFEADAHLFFRRAQQTAPLLGSASECYRRAVAIQGGAG